VTVNLPNESDRTVIVGRTGSGKTQFAVWLLSVRLIPNRRHFVLDFKGESLFAQLNLTPWPIDGPLPEMPGVYWIRILPGEEHHVSQFFLNCYNTTDILIMTDEGYMLPYQDRWVRACLTQGRSKRIEMITLTQRPVRMDVFFLSEASFMSVFALSVKDDRKRVSEYMDGLEIPRLRPYYSLWYDVAANASVIFEPVPPVAELIEAFREEVEEVAQVQVQEDRIIPL
jgi:energy-coupling factor transporter ATP-binding protein EcfA2